MNGTAINVSLYQFTPGRHWSHLRSMFSVVPPYQNVINAGALVAARLEPGPLTATLRRKGVDNPKVPGSGQIIEVVPVEVPLRTPCVTYPLVGPIGSHMGIKVPCHYQMVTLCHQSHGSIQRVPEGSHVSGRMVGARCVAAKEDYRDATMAPSGLKDATWVPCGSSNCGQGSSNCNEDPVIGACGLACDHGPSFTGEAACALPSGALKCHCIHLVAKSLPQDFLQLAGAQAIDIKAPQLHGSCAVPAGRVPSSLVVRVPASPYVS